MPEGTEGGITGGASPTGGAEVISIPSIVTSEIKGGISPFAEEKDTSNLTEKITGPEPAEKILKTAETEGPEKTLEDLAEGRIGEEKPTQQNEVDSNETLIQGKVNEIESTTTQGVKEGHLFQTKTSDPGKEEPHGNSQENLSAWTARVKEYFQNQTEKVRREINARGWSMTADLSQINAKLADINAHSLNEMGGPFSKMSEYFRSQSGRLKRDAEIARFFADVCKRGGIPAVVTESYDTTKFQVGQPIELRARKTTAATPEVSNTPTEEKPLIQTEQKTQPAVEQQPTTEKQAEKGQQPTETQKTTIEKQRDETATAEGKKGETNEQKTELTGEQQKTLDMLKNNPKLLDATTNFLAQSPEMIQKLIDALKDKNTSEQDKEEKQKNTTLIDLLMALIETMAATVGGAVSPQKEA